MTKPAPPYILFEQVKSQTAFSQGEPCAAGPAGYQIWFAQEDGRFDFLGFTENGREAAEHYLKGDLPIYYRNLPKN